MSKKILIIAFPMDYHALAIQALLRKQGHDADIVDTADFPASIGLSHQGYPFSDVRLNGRALSEYHSIWWRRPLVPRASPDIQNSEEAVFAARECRDALWGALHASGLPIYNDPLAEQRANYKPFQLKVASTCGMSIPDTLITTSADEVREFRAKHGEIIYKSFGPMDQKVMETRPLLDADLDDLWRLKYAPAIFQRFIPLGREYRVTVVEDDVFAGEVRIRSPESKYDWRSDVNYQVLPVELPAGIADQLRKVRAGLGLSSGSADLRESPDGTVYFLEMNPSGQFLFLDIHAGVDIASRFCQMLLR